MSPKKLSLIVLAALALALPACTRSASTPPAATATVGAGIVQPLTPNATLDPLAVLAQGATQTVMAAAGTYVPTSTPSGGAAVATQGGVTLPSPTLMGGATQGAAGTPVVVGTPAPTYMYTPAPKPASYTLQKGEFPYCIARRFNVNPNELLTLNGLTNGSLYEAGLTLKIPQTSLTFPGEAALIPHPATYTVLSGDTIYSVACKYGNVDPMAIAAANGLQSPYTLTVGNTIQIP
jgi:LysM repeat protein